MELQESKRKDVRPCAGRHDRAAGPESWHGRAGDRAGWHGHVPVHRWPCAPCMAVRRRFCAIYLRVSTVFEGFLLGGFEGPQLGFLTPSLKPY